MHLTERPNDPAPPGLDLIGLVTPVDLCRQVLAAVSQQGSTPTVYSNIFDLQQRVMHLYHLQDFENAVSLKLEKELEKGPHTVDIASLFPNAPSAGQSASFQKEPVSRMMMRVIEAQNVTEAISQFKRLKMSGDPRYDCSERVLNLFGIDLAYMGRVADAIEVLKLVVEEHPQSANAYDSLAWAFMQSGQTEPAISNYEKSLELNPKNANAVRRLEELRGKSQPL